MARQSGGSVRPSARNRFRTAASILTVCLCVPAIVHVVRIGSVPTAPTARPIDLPHNRCCGPFCRDRSPQVEAHYDQKYFNWQTKLGQEKAQQQDWNKLLGTQSDDVVADLGAGGGHILAVLNVSRRIAVEISDVARDAMEKVYPGMIEGFRYPEDLPDDSVDLMFSTSAIEHFECPLTELREMARKVKVGGRVVIGIKNEGVAYGIPIKDPNVDMHMYTWSGQQLYNLVKSAGFTVDRVDPPLDAMHATAATWTSKEHFKSYNTFIYHWAHGRKTLPTPP